MTLAASLVAAQAEFSKVSKDSTNPFFKSRYASLPNVIATASPVLAKHGLAVSQFISYEVVGETIVDTLVTIILHESGESLQNTARLHLIKDDPQAHGSAVTYMRRYCYMAALGLVTDDDDDANLASRPSPKHTMLKAALEKKFPQSADRKIYIEAQIGRRVSGLTDLTEAEVEKVIQSIKEKS